MRVDIEYFRSIGKPDSEIKNLLDYFLGKKVGVEYDKGGIAVTMLGTFGKVSGGLFPYDYYLTTKKNERGIKSDNILRIQGD